MALTFEEQNAFNEGAAACANKGGKNPHSIKAQPELYKAREAGWAAENAARLAMANERKPS
jgi:hypothetical protein